MISNPIHNLHLCRRAQSATFVHLPANWESTSDEDLLLIAKLTAANMPTDDVAITVVVRHILNECGARQLSRTPSVLIDAMARRLEFIRALPSSPVRPAKIGNFLTPPADLAGYTFGEFLQLENLYQAALQHLRRDAIDQCQPLCLLSDKLFNLPAKVREGVGLGPLNLLTFYWYQGLKRQLAATYCHLFKPAELSPADPAPSQRERMDMMLLALTDGDITKEQDVLNTDYRRALTYLDEKAAECEKAAAS